MAINPQRLKKSLTQSKTQQSNNALYQTINEIIGNLQELLTTFITRNELLLLVQNIRPTEVVEIDTSGGPVSVILADYVFANLMIFKDITGNAAANNIILVGTVDGVVDPVINTNFGFMHIYQSVNLNTLHEW